MKFKKYKGGETPLILIHGLAGLFNSWEYNIHALREKFTVYEVFLPDYKKQPAGYSIAEYVMYTVSIINENNLSNVVVAGNSLGGQIASIIAARYPSIIRGLILIASSGLYDETENLKIIMTHRASYNNVRNILKSIFFNDKFCTKELIFEGMNYYNDRNRIYGIIRTAKKAKTYNIKELVKRISVPTLLIWGENDQVIPPSVGYKFKNLISKSMLTVCGSCGHAPQIECAHAVNQQILNFEKYCGK